jgi:hypothetical protein
MAEAVAKRRNRQPPFAKVAEGGPTLGGIWRNRQPALVKVGDGGPVRFRLSCGAGARVAAKMTENGKFTNTTVDGNLCVAAVT